MNQTNNEDGERSTNDLVIIGSSAGSIEALSLLVSTLQPDFPSPIVIAQHLDSTRHSILDLILHRRTHLTLEIITSSSQLQRGKIYIVPSNSPISIKNNVIEILEERQKRPRPSLDTLLTKAAEVYGDRLVVVLLSGSTMDGGSGAVEVKNAGGTIIVQSAQPLPLSLPPTAVDFEIDIENIGNVLQDLLDSGRIQTNMNHQENVLREILELVSRQSAIDFHPYKTSTILRRIQRRMTVTHNRMIYDYLEYLKSYPNEVGELVKAFLINVTQFFRDDEAFAYLKSDILPKLIARGRERNRVLRFWTAGCATGEEPYSLAMLLTDILSGELPEWSIKIFATDLDEAAINFARRGLYTENLLKGLPIEYRDRFFERVDQGYRISKILRQMVIFGQQDLSRSAPFPLIDLVICRNVLIYFTPELQDYVLNQFAFSLSPNGYLFLGKAETVRPTQSFYELINKHWKIYRCTGNALPSTRRHNLKDLNTPGLEGRSMNRQDRNSGKQHADQDHSSPSSELGQLRHFNELLLRFLPIGVVVIDRNYRILTVNGAARRLLGLRDMSIEQDFLHSVRGIPYYEIRNAIDTVFREKNTITLPEIELDVSAGGNGRFVNLVLALMQLESGPTDLSTISIIDVTEQIHTRRQLETIQAEQTQLMNELGTANKRLSDINKEVMDTNEELQVANEELVLAHEELQASIEEFETTNEELQATNEELETNNEELQATNEELETTNDELRARTSELQELAGILEGERIRLSEMVELAPFYILVLRGPTLVVEAYNPRYAPLLEGRTIQGHPLDEITDLFWETQSGTAIVSLAREVYHMEVERTTPRMQNYLPHLAEESAESYFTYTLVPSHDIHGRVDGVIIYSIDETKQHVRETQEELERLQLIFNNTSVAILGIYDAHNAKFVTGTPRYLEIVASQGTKYVASPHIWYDLNISLSREEAIHTWQQVLEKRQTLRIPEVYYHPQSDEPEIIWYYTLTPIMDNKGLNNVLFVLVSAIDITEQVQARKKLEQLDQLKDDFLSLATHELRSPLTNIQGNAQILQRLITNPLPDQTIDAFASRGITHLERIVYQVTQMNKLIEEMLDVTRIRGKMFSFHNHSAVNIVELVKHVTEQYAGQKHEIITQFDTEAILVTCDEDRIEQVINNLLSNAVKYSPTGKPIMVTVEQSEDGKEAIVSVKDEGYGIKEEKQEHIFDRFYRAHNYEDMKIEGLGLGLYIAHEIVVQQGGRIWLKSRLDEGSTFYFSLPISE